MWYVIPQKELFSQLYVVCDTHIIKYTIGYMILFITLNLIIIMYGGIEGYSNN